MKKKDLVKIFTEQQHLDPYDGSRIVDAVFHLIRDQILEGNELRINGVGTFNFKIKKGGEKNNNLTGKKCIVKPKVLLKFCTSPKMQKMINENLSCMIDALEGVDA